MNSIYIVIFALSTFYLGYRYYSKYLEKNYNNDSIDPLPSKQYNDGIDFVPTNKHLLFGHHFTSIAGAAPIIGPCIAVYWGWLPAVIWVVIGTIFMGAVHDYSSLVISIRENGKSIADITGKVINKRVRMIFLSFVICLTWLVLAVFAMVIATLFTEYPSSVIPINIEIVIAIVIGYLTYKNKKNNIYLSIAALISLYIFVWVGTLYPIDLHTIGFKESKSIWILFLFIYSSIASLLPVWILLQPRDYINSHQLIVALVIIYLSIIVFQPSITAPIIQFPNDAPPMIPFLFITIACGAISGFHGLVSSGTTSKQIKRKEDARLIGYGSMLGEGSLAIATIVASVAGIALVTNCDINDIHYSSLDWNNYYNSWKNTVGNKSLSFVLGGAALIEKIGIPMEVARTLLSVMVISFAATTLDTATRIQRMIITEFGTTTKIPILQNKYIATIIGVVPAYLLTINGAGGKLWPIFGASNQMLAAITLMVLSVYFFKLNKNIIPLSIPMVIVMIITLISLFIKTNEFISSNNYLLVSISLTLIILIFWMIIECYLFVRSSIAKSKI